MAELQKCRRFPDCGGRHTSYQPCVGAKTSKLQSDAPPKPSQARPSAPKPVKATVEVLRAETAKTAAQFDRKAYQKEYMKKYDMKEYMRKRRAAAKLIPQ